MGEGKLHLSVRQPYPARTLKILGCPQWDQPLGKRHGFRLCRFFLWAIFFVHLWALVGHDPSNPVAAFCFV